MGLLTSWDRMVLTIYQEKAAKRTTWKTEASAQHGPRTGTDEHCKSSEQSRRCRLQPRVLTRREPDSPVWSAALLNSTLLRARSPFEYYRHTTLVQAGNIDSR
jgi:hypothetical protein